MSITAASHNLSTKCICSSASLDEQSGHDSCLCDWCRYVLVLVSAIAVPVYAGKHICLPQGSFLVLLPDHCSAVYSAEVID